MPHTGLDQSLVDRLEADNAVVELRDTDLRRFGGRTLCTNITTGSID